MKRSPFKLILPLALALLASSLRAADQKPDILYVVADDLGWKDMGFHGAADIKTPNLDKLAAGGARLEQFYAQPRCTPTRAALMTGRYPLLYGTGLLVCGRAHLPPCGALLLADFFRRTTRPQ